MNQIEFFDDLCYVSPLFNGINAPISGETRDERSILHNTILLLLLQSRTIPHIVAKIINESN